MRAVASFAFCLAFVALSPNVRAQPIASEPDFAFDDPRGEAVLFAFTLATLASTTLPQQQSNWGPDAAREHDKGYAFASDLTGAAIGSVVQMAVGFGFEASYYQATERSEPYGRAARLMLMDIEALALTVGVTTGVKRIAGRCRPRSFQNGRCRGDGPEDFMGFPSGHTSTVSALAGVRLPLLIQTEGPIGYRAFSFASAEAAAVATALFRVAAGAHSWEDVVGGWVLGHGAGIFVAAVHPVKTTPADLTQTGSAPSGPAAFTPVSWAGRF